MVHRTDLDLERAGRLRCRHALDHVEDEDPAVRIAQRIEKSLHVAPRLAPRVPGLGIEPGRWQLARQLAIQAAPHLGAPVVASNIAGDAEQPGAKGAVQLERGELPMYNHPQFLATIVEGGLAQAEVAQDAPGELEMFIIELLEPKLRRQGRRDRCPDRFTGGHAEGLRYQDP